MFPAQFSDYFHDNVFGIITGTFAQSSFPNVEARIARLHARSTNAGSFFLSNSPALLLGYELSPDTDTGWFSVPNGNLMYLYHSRSSGSSDFLEYWVQR